MNRQQRRKAQKQLKTSENIQKMPYSSMAGRETFRKEIDRQLDQELNKVRTEAANRSLNLVMGGMIVTLLGQGMSVDNIDLLIEKIVSKLEAVLGTGITFEELMETCHQAGFKIGEMDYDKVKKSADEVIELIKKYEGMKEMSTKTDVYAKLAKGETDCSKIANDLGVSKKTVEAYRTQWNKDQKKLKNTQKIGIEEKDDIDRLADKIFEDEPKEEVKAPVEIKEEPQEQDKKVLEIPKKSPKFEVERTVKIRAEFGTYTIENKVAEVMLETREMGLTKKGLESFAEELLKVAGEM